EVRDVRLAVERQCVVLAQGEGRDGALDDLAVTSLDAHGALRRERRAQLRVAVVAGGRVEHRTQESLRRLARAGRVQVHAERLEDLGHVTLVARPLLRGGAALPTRAELNDAQGKPPDLAGQRRERG